MPRVVILCLFIWLDVIVIAQTYVPMPMQNCYWQITHGSYCSVASGTPPVSFSQEIYKVSPQNDTIIATKRYIKMYSQIVSSSINFNCSISGITSGYWGAVRQDTLGKKIYYVYPNQTIESLLYNFNYNKGDSVKTLLGSYLSPPYPLGVDRYRVVDSVFYQSYSDGICRKTFRMKSYMLNFGYTMTESSYFIEGIGNDAGLDQKTKSVSSSIPNVSITGEGWSSFLVINNATISAVTTNTCQQDVGLKENTFLNRLKIFPNPAHDKISIQIDNYGTEHISVVIYDLLGNEILRSQSLIIRIEHFTPGSYIIKCFNSETKVVGVQKFIKD